MKMAFMVEKKTCACGKTFNGNYYDHSRPVCNDCRTNAETEKRIEFIEQFDGMSTDETIQKLIYMIYELQKEKK